MDSPRRSRTELAGGGTWHSAWDRQTLSQHKLANDLEEHARRADALVASLDQKITSARALEDEQTQISRAAASNTSVGGVSPRHVSIFGGASVASGASSESISSGSGDGDGLSTWAAHFREVGGGRVGPLPIPEGADAARDSGRRPTFLQYSSSCKYFEVSDADLDDEGLETSRAATSASVMPVGRARR